MKAAKKPSNEKERLLELESYDILDSENEVDFDNLTHLASEICGTEISVVSLIDKERQWFKSKSGLNASETPREQAFCSHAILKPNDIFIVKDAKKDERFHDNPLVIGEPNIAFYAGVPLISENGYPLGTLCVIDSVPKDLDEKKIEALKILSKQVSNLMELRKKTSRLQETNRKLKEKSKQIEKFAHTAAHDLKSPLNSINGFSKLLLNKKENFDEHDLKMLNFINKSSNKLKTLIDGLLEYRKLDEISPSCFTTISTKTLLEDLKLIIPNDENCSINLKSDLKEININKAALITILQNLITNSIKYTFDKDAVINIDISENSKYYKFKVKDNGPGIAKKHHKSIFKPLTTLTAKDKYGNKGTGLGLANIKNIIERLGGSIKLKSELGEGASFIFKIKK